MINLYLVYQKKTDHAKTGDNHQEQAKVQGKAILAVHPDKGYAGTEYEPSNYCH